MTAQVHDSLYFKGEKYDIINSSEDIGFNPEDYGVKVEAPTTALWRGFKCEFAIKYSKLCIKDLYVFNQEGIYPEINGVKCSAKTGMYYDVNIDLDYTGKLILGSGFNSEFYIHMGFQQPWAFDKMVEITFLKGQQIDFNDYSSLAKDLRTIYGIYQERFDECELDHLDSLRQELNRQIQDIVASYDFDYSNLWWM